MAKIVLGKRPKSFKKLLKVKLPEGDEGSIELTYIYRTRREYAEFMDDFFKSNAIVPKGTSEEDILASLKEFFERQTDQQTTQILKFAEGWNLDVEFTAENVAQLCNELPGVALAAIDAYRAAVVEGRLGN